MAASYNAADFRRKIANYFTLLEFTYNGAECNIDPFPPNGFHVCCAGDEWDVGTVDELMSGKFFMGASLEEILPNITNFSW